MNPLVLLLIVFFVLVFIRVPIACALGISSVVTIVYLDLRFTSVINQIYTGIDNFTLLAVPFFLYIGGLINDGGIIERLLQLYRVVVGHILGGFAHINIFVSKIIAGLSVSAALDTAEVGPVFIPAMK